MSLAPGTKRYESHMRETTRWEDILVEKKILAPDAKLEAQKQALEQSKQRGEQAEFTLDQKLELVKLHGSGNAAMDNEMLNAVEDDLIKDDDDERVLQRFREARIREMKQQTLENKFGTCETLARDEFVLKVKQASKTEGAGGKPVYVVIELFKSGIPKSDLTTRAVSQLCKQHLNVKFVRMVSDQCIENYPDSNVPSIFIYFDGEVVKQLIGFEQCGSGDVISLERAICAVMKTKPKLTSLFSEVEQGGGDDGYDDERRRRGGRASRKDEEDDW